MGSNEDITKVYFIFGANQRLITTQTNKPIGFGKQLVGDGQNGSARQPGGLTPDSILE